MAEGINNELCIIFRSSFCMFSFDMVLKVPLGEVDRVLVDGTCWARE